MSCYSFRYHFGILDNLIYYVILTVLPFDKAAGIISGQLVCSYSICLISSFLASYYYAPFY
jgi:hypothetical protein